MKAWQVQIDRVGTWEELLDVARAYLASLSPEEWNSLPESSRPARIKGADDLTFWHERLADEFVQLSQQKGADDSVLRRMLVFFTAAAERSGELCDTAHAPSGDASNDRRERREGGRRQGD
jgi:hypothetical protein